MSWSYISFALSEMVHGPVGLAVAALLSFVGGAAFIAGLWGTPIPGARVCRRCKHIVTPGTQATENAPPPTVCPECGADLTTRRSITFERHKTSWWRMGLGAMLILMGPLQVLAIPPSWIAKWHADAAEDASTQALLPLIGEADPTALRIVELTNSNPLSTSTITPNQITDAIMAMKVMTDSSTGLVATHRAAATIQTNAPTTVGTFNRELELVRRHAETAKWSYVGGELATSVLDDCPDTRALGQWVADSTIVIHVDTSEHRVRAQFLLPPQTLTDLPRNVAAAYTAELRQGGRVMASIPFSVRSYEVLFNLPGARFIKHPPPQILYSGLAPYAEGTDWAAPLEMVLVPNPDSRMESIEQPVSGALPPWHIDAHEHRPPIAGVFVNLLPVQVRRDGDGQPSTPPQP